MAKGYLVGMPEREYEACRRLVQLPFLSERLFGSLGLQPEFSWYLLQIRKELLGTSLLGDVDILAGRLSWSDPDAFEALVAEERANAQPERHDSWNYKLAALRLARAGGISWPPSCDHVVGLEAKCAYWEACAGGLKSTKSGKTRKIRKQVESLLEMGLDQVALLDIIANPPVSGPNGRAWISALNVAATSRDAMFPIVRERLEDDCEAAHWVWSIGAIVGGDELCRGAGAPIEVRPSRGNSRLAKVIGAQSARQEVEQHLKEMFTNLQAPTIFPAIFVDCKDCRIVHGMPLDGSVCARSFTSPS